MTQLIIAGVVGLLLGFGVGQWTDDAVDPPLAQHAQEREMRQESADLPLPDDFVSVRPQLDMMAMESLSAEERSGLLYMREEEKLARDVYQTLYEQWQTPIFANIAQSEQTHTEAVRQLLEKYDVPDPVTDDTVGVFTDPELQTLYDELTAAGSESLVAALRVGATIEDLDIKDLADELAVTDNEDITLVYQNLQRGSRNHLRSFVAQLERQGAMYEPQYISEAEYEAIIGSDRETGTGASRGWGGDRSGGHGNGQGGRN